MIFERTKPGEIMALARLLNVREEDLMKEARVWQPKIKSLEQIDDTTYGKLLDALMLFVKLKAEGQAEVFTDIYEEDSEDDEDEYDLEKQMDKWEVQYLDGERRDADIRAHKYQDYCERKYGWDFS